MSSTNRLDDELERGTAAALTIADTLAKLGAAHHHWRIPFRRSDYLIRAVAVPCRRTRKATMGPPAIEMATAAQLRPADLAAKEYVRHLWRMRAAATTRQFATRKLNYLVAIEAVRAGAGPNFAIDTLLAAAERKPAKRTARKRR
jgi:hypothetical protein